MEIIRRLNKLFSYPLVLAIWVYQRTLSPDHGLLKAFYPRGYCKYYPSCSEFSKQVLLNQGIQGLPKIINRLVRCNPFSFGGVDLP